MSLMPYPSLLPTFKSDWDGFESLNLSKKKLPDFVKYIFSNKKNSLAKSFRRIFFCRGLWEWGVGGGEEMYLGGWS